MRSTMLDMDSRMRVATAVEQDETRASRSVFEILQRRGHPDAPPPTISDGWGGIDEAMLAVYGLTLQYSGRRASTHAQKAWERLVIPNVQLFSKILFLDAEKR